MYSYVTPKIVSHFVLGIEVQLRYVKNYVCNVVIGIIYVASVHAYSYRFEFFWNKYRVTYCGMAYES